MKSITSSLKHFIVQKAHVSNKTAVSLILSGSVLVNGKKGKLDQMLKPEDQVTLKGKTLKEAVQLIYLAYHKPPGIESTLNLQIENNLRQAVQTDVPVFPVGRLDKESEGLMLLTNDGQIFDKISHAQSHQEKEYVVTVDKPLTPDALDSLAKGIVIMGQKTRPAQVRLVNENTFSIILTQGLNRQIRRMCYKLSYQVLKLVRIRIKSLFLGTLPPGQWRPLEPEQVIALWQDLPE